MNTRLFLSAITKYILGIVIIGLLLFVPAGTINYYNGLLFMGLLFIPMFIAGIVMMIFNPKLLESRLDAKEQENEQKVVILLSGVMFISGFIIAGLNYRFDWIHMSKSAIIVGSIIFVLAYILYAEVLRENTYLSRTVEVKKDQKLVDTGLYGIVRHPMYLATILLFLSIPLILDSIISFIIFLFYPFIIAKRINNEEKVLENKLKGYKEYKNKVKYKVIPYIY